MSDVAPNAHLEELSPAPLWRHFRMLCNTPRPSGQEEAVMQNIIAWANGKGFETSRDQVGNLLVRKPATQGYENVPVVTLQSHVDMVTQADGDYDFTKEPIHTEVREGWLWAKGTTLGADNGIGAAGALAILEDDKLTHGPLEALFTVSEETSMGGASELAPDWLKGRYMLNMDSEDRGEAYIGCAGGVHVRINETFSTEQAPEGWSFIEIAVNGLQGGHSGVDISKQLGSANRILPRALLATSKAIGNDALRLVSYQGGQMSNAITRAANAIIAVPADKESIVAKTISEVADKVKTELAVMEPDVNLTQTQSASSATLSLVDSLRVIRLLAALPYGVERYSDELPGVVETSDNIGVVSLQDGQLKSDVMVRSLRDSAALDLSTRIEALARLGGFEPKSTSFYPGWVPIPASPLLSRFEVIHKEIEGHAPEVKVIHAGLECGIIGAKYPDLEMISFGPTIKGAHSPSERVDLAAVEAFWKLLHATVESLAKSPLPA